MMKTIQNVRIYSNNKIQTMKKNQDELNRELKNTIILLEMQRKLYKAEDKTSGLEYQGSRRNKQGIRTIFIKTQESNSQEMVLGTMKNKSSNYSHK